jgi:putative FmdB family regulatory protein
MPLYEYICLDCKTRFDALRSIKDADARINCPGCAGERTARQLSVFFAHSDGRLVAQSSSGCAGCSGGACATCGH